jgi:trk system potassium uptake protein TrkA
MKIIILGAGQVGSSVAQNLASEANDITVVDHRADILQDLQDRIDIRTVVGSASHPEVLMRAGAEDASRLPGCVPRPICAIKNCSPRRHCRSTF